MYQLEYDNKDIVVRFERDSIDKTLLASLLEYLEIEQIRMKSKLTEKQAKQLAKQINQSVWEKIKEKYIEE
ncbi:MAG: hypothetical protein HUU32_20170 [Calditrichaceae bacterium]|nr:hypothetical protein [Calditrichia bacterium]NUQ43715.1 hypothetical protein [Calditrichaceae bacterium]